MKKLTVSKPNRVVMLIAFLSGQAGAGITILHGLGAGGTAVFEVGIAMSVSLVVAVVVRLLIPWGRPRRMAGRAENP